MNIIKIQDQLKNAPDDALVGYVQNPTGHVPTYLALSELQRRKEMRNSYQANKPEEKTVAEDLVQEAQPQPQMPQEGVAGLPEAQPMMEAMAPPPEMPMQQMAQGGLAELDVGDMFNEQSYADGGIVAFADGGDTEKGMNIDNLPSLNVNTGTQSSLGAGSPSAHLQEVFNIISNSEAAHPGFRAFSRMLGGAFKGDPAILDPLREGKAPASLIADIEDPSYFKTVSANPDWAVPAGYVPNAPAFSINPSGNTNAQHSALSRMAQGGEVQRFAGLDGSYVNPELYGRPTNQSFLDKLRFGFSSPDEIKKANMGEGMPQNPFMGYMPDANRDPMTIQAQIGELYKQLNIPGVDKTAIYQQINELEGRNKRPYDMGGYQLTKEDLAPPKPPKPQDQNKGKGAGPNPFDAMMTKEKSLKELSDEYMGILGEDKGAKRLSERLAKMDEKAAKQEEQAPWLALAKAGFEMANTRAEYGKAAETPFASLARGAGAGIKDYAESKEALNKLEEKRFLLDNELSKQSRAEQVAALNYGKDSKQHTEQINKTIQLAKMKDNTERELANLENNTKIITAMQKGNWDKKDYFKTYNEVEESDAFKKAEKEYIDNKGGSVVNSPQYNQWKDNTIKQLIRQKESPSGTSADSWTNFSVK